MKNVSKYITDKLLDRFNELTENFDAVISNIYTIGFLTALSML